ncbi:MAG: dihydrodipicolinate synthase family protein [Pseudomonadota bacterium]
MTPHAPGSARPASSRQRIRGVLAPVLTPFDDQLAPDIGRFTRHCSWLLEQRVGLAIFGTNSEAASLSAAERMMLTEALLEAGIPASRLMPGTGACSLSEAVLLTRHAVRHGAAGVLALPPFFFKAVSEDGLFRFYSEVIERVADDRLNLYLYNIPQFSGVPITLELIERLLKRYPDIVAGAKDSSGDWNNSLRMIEAFGADGFDVFPASESLLGKGMRAGAAGCISATVNVHPSAIQALYDNWSRPDAERLQANVDAVRRIFETRPMIPAMKATVAHYAGADESWRSVRPPLVAMNSADSGALVAALEDCGFDMPGYPQASVVDA